jgi:hypothetical protein
MLDHGLRVKTIGKVFKLFNIVKLPVMLPSITGHPELWKEQ